MKTLKYRIVCAASPVLLYCSVWESWTHFKEYTIRKTLTGVIIIFVTTALWFWSFQAHAQEYDIQPYTENNQYWQYNGEPVFLMGGNLEDNSFQIYDYITYLDDMVAINANYVRCVMSDRDEPNHISLLKAYHQGSDGKYDLNQWDNAGTVKNNMKK